MPTNGDTPECQNSRIYISLCMRPRSYPQNIVKPVNSLDSIDVSDSLRLPARARSRPPKLIGDVIPANGVTGIEPGSPSLFGPALPALATQGTSPHRARAGSVLPPGAPLPRRHPSLSGCPALGRGVRMNSCGLSSCRSRNLVRSSLASLPSLVRSAEESKPESEHPSR